MENTSLRKETPFVYNSCIAARELKFTRGTSSQKVFHSESLTNVALIRIATWALEENAQPDVLHSFLDHGAELISLVVRDVDLASKITRGGRPLCYAQIACVA